MTTKAYKQDVRDCYIGARFTKKEKAQFLKRHKIRGREASKLIRNLLLNGEIK